MIDDVKAQIRSKRKLQEYSITKTFHQLGDLHDSRVGKMRQMMDSFSAIFSQTVLEVLTPDMVSLLDESFETSPRHPMEIDLFDAALSQPVETTDATTNKLTDLDALVLSDSDSRGEQD